MPTEKYVVVAFVVVEFTMVKLVMVEVELLTRIPELKVCRAVQVLALPRLREATTDPVVGDMVRVPSEFATEDTPVVRQVPEIA